MLMHETLFWIAFQERRNWREEKSQLESQIELITKAHAEDLENERVRLICCEQRLPLGTCPNKIFHQDFFVPLKLI